MLRRLAPRLFLNTRLVAKNHLCINPLHFRMFSTKPNIPIVSLQELNLVENARNRIFKTLNEKNEKLNPELEEKIDRAKSLGDLLSYAKKDARTINAIRSMFPLQIKSAHDMLRNAFRQQGIKIQEDEAIASTIAAPSPRKS